MQNENLNIKELRKRADDIRKQAITEATAKANAEYNRLMESIEKLMGTPRLDFSSSEPEQPASVNGSWFGLKRAIERFVEESAAPFMTGEVIKYLDSKYPSQKINPASVSTSLWTMAKNKEIECLYRGHGRDPSRYIKKS